MKKILFLLLSLYFVCQSSAQTYKLPKIVKQYHDELNAFYEKKKVGKDQLTEEKRKAYTAYLKNYYDTVTDYYRYYQTKKQIIKGVRLYKDNDFLALFDNRDHEYTGGFRIEVITDYLGLKLFSWRRENRFLSYQSLFFGFELYTPDVIDVKSKADLNPLDRPFASFQYIGKSRNIINIEGTYRATSELKVGIIGGEVSRNFQRIIHRDIIDSENNNGWDYQIANGGRFALQYNLRNEWQHKFKNKNLYFNYGFNLGAGWEKNFIGPVLSLTNKSFFEKNAHYALNSANPYFGAQSWSQQVKQTFFYELKLEPEIVIYNTMLQGYPRKNKDFVFVNNTRVDVPVLKKINHLVGRFSLGVGFRNYNSTFLFEYYFQTPEYDYSWKDKFFHRYARVSFTMNI